jgi:hypothetical protein
MIIANLSAMFENGLDKEYEYKNHRWMNQQLSCGCTIAICLDVELKKEEHDYVSKLFTKNNTLQSFIKEAMFSTDEEIKKRFDEFENEILETKALLSDFIVEKRAEYEFPNGVDFNGEYYSIKIKQGKDCRN